LGNPKLSVGSATYPSYAEMFYGH